MKFVFSVIASFIIFFGLSNTILAQDTTVQDLVGTNEAAETTQTTVTPSKENPLGLDMPEQTDNPSTIITFSNPSTNNTNIQLEIDSKGFVEITSPYTLPALSIGRHTLEFKYQDENSATQIYSDSIIIIPRAPVLGTPVITTESVKISGTGLANSEIILLLSSGTINITQESLIDEDGKWSMEFSRDELLDDIYTANAYTRRYGYASDLSATTKFTLDASASSNSTGKDYLLDLSSISITSIKDWVVNKQDYILLAVCAFVLGIIVGIVSRTQRAKAIVQKTEEKVAKEFQKNEKKTNEMTLKEKLMGGKDIKKEEKTEVQKEEEAKKQDEVVNKIDFLKDYKNFDPDNAQGKEQESKVDVTLTSKR